MLDAARKQLILNHRPYHPSIQPHRSRLASSWLGVEDERFPDGPMPTNALEGTAVRSDRTPPRGDAMLISIAAYETA